MDDRSRTWRIYSGFTIRLSSHLLIDSFAVNEENALLEASPVQTNRQTGGVMCVTS